jgi:hypothetical protein
LKGVAREAEVLRVDILEPSLRDGRALAGIFGSERAYVNNAISFPSLPTFVVILGDLEITIDTKR